MHTGRLIFGGKALAQRKTKAFTEGKARHPPVRYKSGDGGNIDNAPEAARGHFRPENMAKLGYCRHHDLHHVALHIPTHAVEKPGT